jgi:predicted ABC-type ATPase
VNAREPANDAGTPLVVLLAGPDGAGKSTSAADLLRGALTVDEFVNADTIAMGLSAYRPQSTAVTAGRVMLERLHHLAMARADFAFETTLSGRAHARWLRSLRASGYRSHLIFLSLPAPEAAIARVAERVGRGGHDVPADVIRRRYVAGLRNLFGVYQQVVDTWQVYDNSSLQGPRLLASGVAGAQPAIVDLESWARLERYR